MRLTISITLTLFAAATAGQAVSAVNGAEAKALELMAACKRATGGSALDKPDAFHEHGVMIRDGQSGSYDTFGDMRSLRSAGSQTFSGKTRWGGFDGESSWHAGPDGKVAKSADPQVLKGERMGTYLTLSGYLYPERFAANFRYQGRRQLHGHAYDVVLVTPKDADSAELWLDVRTHRLAHLEASAGGEKVVGDITDYRNVAGTWVGFALDMTDNGRKLSLRLASLDYIPLDEAHLSPPER